MPIFFKKREEERKEKFPFFQKIKKYYWGKDAKKKAAFLRQPFLKYQLRLIE